MAPALKKLPTMILSLQWASVACPDGLTLSAAQAVISEFPFWEFHWALEFAFVTSSQVRLTLLAPEPRVSWEGQAAG